MIRFARFAVMLLVATSLASADPEANREATSSGAARAHSATAFKIKVTPVGVSQAQIDAIEKALPKTKTLAPLVENSNCRILYTEFGDPGENEAIGLRRFRTVLYDYTRQVAIVVEGLSADLNGAVAHEVKNWQPEVNDSEFEDAVALVRNDRTLGSALKAGDLISYRPMPPVQGWAEDAVTERIVNVGLRPRAVLPGLRHEIVGVNLGRRTIVRYPNGAPRRANAGEAQCGAPPAGQKTTRRGTPGQYELIVTDTDGTVLWDMIVLRPAVSSGTNASGIELQNVKYKGVSVLKRAHVPILNVLYVDGECGPYRDWEYQEGMFEADGVDIAGAPGFRDCGTTPATTVLETGTDVGNFRGVALYRQGTEVVLVTEMEAGWYRYIHEWGFDADGTIHPRFGFGATANSCTCFPHTHHAYWRFDFDVEGTPNVIHEIPLQSDAGSGAPIAIERKLFRNDTKPMYYRISGPKRSYLLYPGENDGNADKYGKGDMWFLHRHDGPDPVSAEIDDGHSFFDATAADIDQFLTGESLKKEDVVVWYHASFLHTPDDEMGDSQPSSSPDSRGQSIGGPEVVGPDLVPVGY